MGWWNIGNKPPLSGTAFLRQFVDDGQLTNPARTAADAFERIESKDAQLSILGQIDAASRKDLLGAMGAVERDQLIGGTAFDASIHHTGPAFRFDWSTFQPRETDYSPANAHAMAIASKRVYEVPETMRREYEAQGFSVQTFDHSGTQAFLAVKDDVAILSFRGTEPEQIEDLLTDAQANQTAAHNGKVHKGFQRGLDAVWPDITQALLRAGVKEGKPLFITGHSLGAALGTLAASRLQHEQGVTTNGLYTFGSPRVGNQDFADAFNASELGERTWRFRNNNDGVTIIPPHGPLLGYSHVGTEIYFDNNGQAHNQPSSAFTAEDRKSALFSPTQEYFLKKFNRMRENDNNPLEHLESMWDHGMTGYVKHIFVNQDFQAQASDNPKR